MRERIQNLEQFRALQEKFMQARSHEKRKVLVCCGTGCAAGGNLAVYEELKTQMEAHGAAFELSLNEGCGGDENEYVRRYYDNVADCAALRPLYMAHFDLLTKFGVIDEESGFYRRTALEALDVLLDAGIPIEINTGAMARKKKDVPYPAAFLMERIAERNGYVVVGSDCHDKTQLDFAFDDALALAKSTGVKNVLVFRGGRLVWSEEVEGR